MVIIEKLPGPVYSFRSTALGLTLTASKPDDRAWQARDQTGHLVTVAQAEATIIQQCLRYIGIMTDRERETNGEP